jgi:hypothetical protein
MTSTLPAVGGGVGVGLLALQLAKRANLSPAVVAGITAGVGAIGTILAPKGTAQNFFSSVAGLGAGLTAIDLTQAKPAAAQPPQQHQLPAQQQHGPPVAQRQASGEHVTREELNEALRRAMIDSNAQMAQHIEGAMRNAMGLRVDAPPAHHQAPEQYEFYEERRDAGDVMREAWHDAPQVHEYDHRNAPEHGHVWDPEHEARNAGEHMHMEDWHHHPPAEAAA